MSWWSRRSAKFFFRLMILGIVLMVIGASLLILNAVQQAGLVPYP